MPNDSGSLLFRADKFFTAIGVVGNFCAEKIAFDRVEIPDLWHFMCDGHGICTVKSNCLTLKRWLSTK